MPGRDDVVFGRVAVQNRFLTQEQVDACMKVVEEAAAEGKTMPLSMVVLRRQFMTDRQVKATANAARYTVVRGRDRNTARVLLHKDLATKEQLDKAAATQDASWKKKAQCTSVVDILIQEGILTRKQAADAVHEAVRGIQEKPAAPTGRRRARDRGITRRVGKCRVVLRTVTSPAGHKVSCLEVAGPIDGDSFSGLQKIVDGILSKEGDPGRFLIMDVEKVSSMSSAGVGVIVSANRAVEDKGGALKLANVSGEVEEILGLVGLNTGLACRNMEAALKAIDEGGSVV